MSLGYGLLVLRGMEGILFPQESHPNRPPLVVVCLLGLAGLIVIINAFSLILAVGWVLHGILLGILAVFLVFDRNWIMDYFRQASPALKNSPVLFALGITMGLFFIVSSVGAITNIDTGLYHAQAVQWIETYPVVPGLGNLHSRLAYNSSWMAANAFFNLSFLRLGPFRILNTFLMVCGLVFFIRKIQRLLENRFSLSSLTALWMLLFMLVFYPGDSSYGTDLAGSLYAWFAILLYLESLEDDQPEGWRAMVILIFLSTAVTIKLSNLPLLLLALPTVLRFSNCKVRFVAIYAGAAAVTFLPFIARNIILSGCILYPVWWLRIPGLDWSIPADLIRIEYDYIKSWARIPVWNQKVVLALPFMEWFSIWWGNLGEAGIFMIVTGFFGNLVIFAKNLFRKGKDAQSIKRLENIWLNSVMVLAFCYWFFTAPDFRFGNAFLVPAFSLALYPLLRRMKPFSARTRQRLTILFVAFCQVLVFSFAIKNITPDYLHYLIHPYGYPAVTVVGHILSPSVSVYITQDWVLCWNSPIPCTYGEIDHLQLRGDTLREGFRYAP